MSTAALVTDFGAVRVTQHNAVCVAELNRPAKLNALDEGALGQLAEAIENIADRAPRAVVIRAAGRAFCAGRDIGRVDPDHDEARHVLDALVNPVVRSVYTLAMPTFAAVQGACLGVGLGLALACDVVYAAADARLGSPFARIGAVLDSGSHAFLVRRIGAARTLDLVYRGLILDGSQAAACGLVDHVMDGAKLHTEVLAAATSVAQGPTAAFAESKRIVRAVVDGCISLDEVLAMEAIAQDRASRSDDYREGFHSFQHKREPRFVGR